MRLENIKKLVDLLDGVDKEKLLGLNDDKFFKCYSELFKKVKYDLEYSDTEWSNK